MDIKNSPKKDMPKMLKLLKSLYGPEDRIILADALKADLDQKTNKENKK